MWKLTDNVKKQRGVWHRRSRELMGSQSPTVRKCESLFELAFWGKGWDDVIRQMTHTLTPCHESVFTIDCTLNTAWNPCLDPPGIPWKTNWLLQTFLDDEWFQIILLPQGYHLANLVIFCRDLHPIPTSESMHPTFVFGPGIARDKPSQLCLLLTGSPLRLYCL